MADLPGGTTGYPNAVDTATNLTSADQIASNHMNGVMAAAVAVETELGTNPRGTAATVRARLDQALNNDGTVQSAVITAATGTSVSYSSGVFSLGLRPSPSLFADAGLVVFGGAGSGGDLELHLRDASLSTPTSSRGPTIGFRDGDAADGNVNLRTATTTSSLTLASGTSLGFGASELGRIYILAVDNGGRIELGAVKRAIFEEGTRVNTTAASVSGDDDETIYTVSTYTDVAFRYLGWLDVASDATVGAWGSAPVQLQVMGPGAPKTGAVLQVVATHTGDVKTGTTTTPDDDTIPQIGEGVTVLWATINQVSTVNSVRIDTISYTAHSNVTRAKQHLHRHDAADAIAVGAAGPIAANVADGIAIHFSTTTYTTGAVGIYMNVGDSGAGTLTLNGSGGSRLMGGRFTTSIILTEIMA